MKRWISDSFWRRVVLERLHRLLSVFIVLQLIQAFSGYWWEETYAVIYGALTVTAITEMLMSRWFGLRLSLQLASIVALCAWTLPVSWRGWPVSWRDWSEVGGFVSAHVGQMHPFLELAAGTVLVVHALAWIGKRRVGAISIIVLSIATMAVVDSFFPLELWRNIAWIVAIGLAWLVVLNLRQLQARHPDSWEALAERPLDIALPAVLTISLLLLTGIFMPRAPILLEDPYTIWSEAQGREVPVFSGEGGIQRVNVSGSQGSSLSGYSRDDRNIGGGFQFDYSPVMTVTTTQRSYWRGETKSVYTGKGWQDERSGSLQRVVPGGEEASVLAIDPPRSPDAETIEVMQTVKFERRDRIPVLFVAGSAVTVNELKSDNNGGLLWNPEEWELRWGRTARVQEYTVVSEIPVLDEEALRRVDRSAGTSIDLDAYLQLPDGLPERVRDLAREQTGGLSNDYDRAKKLEQYLKETFPYTNTPDLSRQSDRENGDIVDAFLFEIQEGYCDYFSTSFVVMARSIGLPARWVKGYATGYDQAAAERARFGAPEDIDPKGAGTYTVRNADAHSWAEVYFEGYGWIPFEPTSGFTVPQPIAVAETQPLEPIVGGEETPVESEPKPVASMNWLALSAAVGIVLILIAAIIVGYRSKRAKTLWTRIRYRGNTPNQRVVREMERLLRFMQRQGLRREAHETLRETFGRWGSNFSSLKSELDGALTTFEQARYGEDNGGVHLLERFNELSARIRKAL